jgi:LIM domain kinase 1
VAILKNLRHPNVVQFVGVTTDPHGSCVIVTDYVPGGNLRKTLKDATKPLPFSWRIKIAADIAGGMAYLHVKNLLFRDLKSKNILVAGNNAKICGEFLVCLFDHFLFTHLSFHL